MLTDERIADLWRKHGGRIYSSGKSGAMTLDHLIPFARELVRHAVEAPRSDHPEDRCESCGGPNIVWFAPSPLWNKYAGNSDIVCPLCFAKMAEAAGCNPTAWTLDVERIAECSPPAPSHIYAECPCGKSILDCRPDECQKAAPSREAQLQAAIDRLADVSDRIDSIGDSTGGIDSAEDMAAYLQAVAEHDEVVEAARNLRSPKEETK